MMMGPDRCANALYATPPLEVVEVRILEMLAAGGNDFIPRVLRSERLPAVRDGAGGSILIPLSIMCRANIPNPTRTAKQLREK